MSFLAATGRAIFHGIVSAGVVLWTVFEVWSERK